LILNCFFLVHNSQETDRREKTWKRFRAGEHVWLAVDMHLHPPFAFSFPEPKNNRFASCAERLASPFLARGGTIANSADRPSAPNAVPR
jgi:hypothetical protein